MNKLLIIEDRCTWNGHLKEAFECENYEVNMCRAEDIQQQMETFKPQIVLVCMGEVPSKGWRIYRLIKALEPCLPVLVYRLATAESVRDVFGTVGQALREARKAGKSGVGPSSLLPAFVIQDVGSGLNN